MQAAPRGEAIRFAPHHLLGAASSDLAAPEQDDADSD